MSDIQLVCLCDYCSLHRNPDREAVLNRRGYWLCQECADKQRKAEIESERQTQEYYLQDNIKKALEIYNNQQKNKMTIISAAEARKRSGKTVEQYLEDINRYIIAATEKGEHKIILHGEYERWLYTTPKKGSIEEKVISALRALGYDVSLHYVEKQFVDMGLIISWE